MKHLLRTAILFLALSCSTITYVIGQSTPIDIRGNNQTFLALKENTFGSRYFEVGLFNSNAEPLSSTFFGYRSGVTNEINGGVFNSGEFNSGFGHNTLRGNTTGQQNTAIGYSALGDNISGGQNTAVGMSSLSDNIDGSGNTAVGRIALRDNISGASNTAIGAGTGILNRHGDNNTFLGGSAGSNDTLSIDNVYIGAFSGRGTLGATDGYHRMSNTMIGSQSGLFNTTSGNVFLGFQAGYNAAVDNQLYITNSSTDSTETLIYGDFGTEDLRLNAAVNINGHYTLPTTAAPGSSYTFRSQGSGQLAWQRLAPWDTNGDDIIYEDGHLGVLDANPSAVIAASGNIRASALENESEYVEIDHDGSNGRINTRGDGNLVFGHDGAADMYLNSDGDLGVGVAPSDALHVRGNGSEDLFRVQLGTDTKMRVYNNGSISLGANISNVSSGDVYVHRDLGLGVTSPKARLDVNGDAIPSVTGTHDLGTSTYRWSTVNGNEGNFRANGTAANTVVLRLNGNNGGQDNTVSTEYYHNNLRSVLLSSKYENPFTKSTSYEIWVRENDAMTQAMVVRPNDIRTRDILPRSNNAYDVGGANAFNNVESYNFTNASDRRVKQNITTAPYGLEEILALEPSTYQYIDYPDQDRLGLIAQDVYKIIPEVVSTKHADRWGIRYMDLVPVLINAVKEVNEEKDQLEDRLAALEQLVQQQGQLIEELSGK